MKSLFALFQKSCFYCVSCIFITYLKQPKCTLIDINDKNINFEHFKNGVLFLQTIVKKTTGCLVSRFLPMV